MAIHCRRCARRLGRLGRHQRPDNVGGICDDSLVQSGSLVKVISSPCLSGRLMVKVPLRSILTPYVLGTMCLHKPLNVRV
jgi:hypothetical protein